MAAVRIYLKTIHTGLKYVATQPRFPFLSLCWIRSERDQDVFPHSSTFVYFLTRAKSNSRAGGCLMFLKVLYDDESKSSVFIS